jgi:EEF1A N-terminal glycine/lysine methyltransferase
VVLTDYPDQALIENMAYNVAQNIEPASQHVSVMGYVWGQPVEPLLAFLDADGGGRGGFDLILLSDLIFNHSQVHTLFLRYHILI